MHGAFDGCVPSRHGTWPATELLPKHEPDAKGDFGGGEFPHGFYSRLQSLHSEDAMTWSVLGTLIHEPVEVRCQWVEEFLRKFGNFNQTCVNPQITLWFRFSHPQTGQEGRGPEIDFMVEDANFILLGESKWLSGLDGKQGVDKNLDQLEIRDLVAQRILSRTHPGVPVYLAWVGIPQVQPPREKPLPSCPLIYACWENVCGLQSHPLAGELQAYLAWKLRWAQPSPSQRALLDA